MTLLDATTLARVKTLLDITDTAHDALLSLMVTSVSKRIEAYIDRPLMLEARTEEYHAAPRTNVLFLKAAPVASITSVINDSLWNFAAGTTVDSDLYHVDVESGRLYLQFDLASHRNAVQVIYTAGFAANTTDLIANYPDIAMAADCQVVAQWRRKNNPQGSKRTTRGGSTEFEAPLQLIPEVIETLSPYRRISFGI